MHTRPLDFGPSFRLGALPGLEVVRQVLEILNVLECDFLTTPTMRQNCIWRAIATVEVLERVGRGAEQAHIDDYTEVRESLARKGQ